MVQKHWVYRKSPLAVEALARRDAALALRLRSLLILVDGKRPVEELAKLSPAGPEAGELLEQLEQMGMVERAAAESAVSGGTAGATPVPARTKSTNVSLPEAQRAAVRHLTDLLGPEAQSLCLRIEAVRTAQDLLAVLQRAESLVRSARGAEAATAFTEHMQAHRPA
jgi:hypothetical protein